MATIGSSDELKREYKWRYLTKRWREEKYRMIEDMLKVPTATGEWVDFKVPDCHVPILKAGLLYNPMPTTCLRWLNKFRQGGFSYIQIGEILCVSHAYPGAQALYVATNEDLAEQWLSKLEKIVEHAKQLPNGKPFVAIKKSESTRLKKVLTNGFVIRGMASTAPAIRSPTALAVIVDEMAWQIKIKEQQKNIITAIRPTLSQGGCFTAQSTPRDTKDEFWKLYDNRDKNNFTCFTIPVFKNPIENVDLTKSFFDQPHLQIQVPWIPMQVLEDERLADVDTFKQERLCIPLDEIQLFLTGEHVRAVVSKNLQNLPFLKTDNPVFMGIDCARKKDLTVVTIIEKVGAAFFERNITELTGNMEVQAQEIIALINRFNPMRVRVDSTGLGISIYDKLYNVFGALIEPVNFSNSAIINRLAINFKTLVLQKRYHMIDHEEAIKQLLRVRKVVTETRIKYTGKKSGRDDHFISKILTPPIEEAQYGHVSAVETSRTSQSAINSMERMMTGIGPRMKHKNIYD